jgi:endo-1,4-beta-xylanase
MKRYVCVAAGSFGVSLVTGWLLATESSVLEKAASTIETCRKGEATLRFQRRDGTGVAGASVKVRQLTHDFPFGNVVRPRHYQNESYLNRFKELFNTVELLEFNWGQYEPDEGKPLREQRKDFINNWCKPNGITDFYGHMLVWTSQYGEYPKTALPLWSFRYDREKQYQLLKARIQREVRDYAGVNMMWDVVNEATHCRAWGDWEKPSYCDEGMDNIVPYVTDALSWAHEANPDARLLINDYRVIVKGTYRDRFKELLEALIKQNVPRLSGVGIQAHEPYKSQYWYSPQELWDTYELFGTELGLPIYITEFAYVSDSSKEIYGSYRSGKWSEALQADAVEEFYRISFGHPRISCIVYFGLSDNDVWKPKIGLLDEEFKPKPVWNRLKSLIWDEWTTEKSGMTSDDGTFRFKGFYGEYEVTLRDRARRYVFTIHLKKDQANDWLLSTE